MKELRPAQELTLQAIAAEVIRARLKFPRNRHLMTALTEEVGEVAKALLQGDFEKAEREAIQVACVAVRLIEEGDSDYANDDEESRKP